MPSTLTVRALLLLALASSSLQAQPGAAAPEPAASAPSATRVVRLKAQSLRPGDTAYPAALAEQGVQGTAEVLVRIAPDGTPADVSLHATSRSAALDEQALAYVRGLRFGARAGAGSGALPDVIVPVEFLRDTIEALQAKTCAEFNIDKAYFKAAFPEIEASRMPVVRMTTGMLLLAGLPRQGGDALVAQARQLNAAAAGIASACEADPQANYLKRFVELVKQAG